MTTIYKKDTSGKIRYLKTWTDGSILHQVTGVVGTENPVPHQKICTPKNVGRSNETSGAEQAILEMNSLIAEKVKGGYFDSIENAQDGEVILPMLAKEYGKEKKKIQWPVLTQPKFDGMRALGDQELISRKGSIIETVPHIIKVIPEIPFHLDGELYGHGIGFQENMRLTKKYRPGESEVIKYCVYDVVSEDPYTKRYLQFMDWWTKDNNDKLYGDVIVAVGFTLCKNQAELDVQHAQNLANGFEGTMVRWGNEPYKINGRSSNLLKYKDFLDRACEIVDIEPAKDRPTWGVPVFEIDGKRFRAGMKFSHAEREEFLAHKQKYIGQIGELRFFEYSEDGIPRFPVMVGIRNDKTKQDQL